MKRIHTTKTEQVLLSAVLVTCSVLVLSAVLLLLTPHVPATPQIAHATSAHVAGVASTAR